MKELLVLPLALLIGVFLKALFFSNYPTLSVFERKIEYDCTPRPEALKCGEYPYREIVTLPETAIVVLNSVKEESYWIHCVCSASIVDYVAERLNHPERFQGPKIVGSLDANSRATLKSL